MGKRLSIKQKAKNKAAYKQIRKVWTERGEGKLSYKEFKNFVIQYSRGTGKSIKESAKIVGNKYQLGSAKGLRDYKDQAKENLLRSMKESYRSTYDELRRKAGRFNKGEHLVDKLDWNEKIGSYVLTSSTGERYAVMSDQSPQNMYLVKM